MKAMSAREAKNQFGAAIDAAQREAVIITKHNRAAAALVSMEELTQIPRYRDLKTADARPETERADKVLRWYGSLHGTFGDTTDIDEFISRERTAWDR